MREEKINFARNVLEKKSRKYRKGKMPNRNELNETRAMIILADLQIN